MVQERPIMNEVSPVNQQPISYYNPTAAPIQPNMAPVTHHHGQPPTNLAHVIPPQPVAAVNGTLHPEDMNVISGT